MRLVKQIVCLERYEYREYPPYVFHTKEAIKRSLSIKGKDLTDIACTSFSNSGYAYACVQVDTVKHNNPAHRIVWELHNGPVPTGYVLDHIDGNKLNNSITNLRLATMAQNSASKPPSCNKYGLAGVHKSKYGWSTKLRDAYGVTCRYPASSPEEAHRIYVEKHKEFWGDFSYFNRINYTPS